MNDLEPRFRLRDEDTIVGYMRKVADTMVLYSKDSFWWTGRKITYNEIDEWTGFKDKNGRYVYEWDILHFKLDPDAEYEKGVVLWEGRNREFGIRNLNDGSFIPLVVDGVKMFNERQLQVFSYLFLNRDLQLKLGVRD